MLFGHNHQTFFTLSLRYIVDLVIFGGFQKAGYINFLNLLINPQWLALPMFRTNCHGPKDVPAIEFRLHLQSSHKAVLPTNSNREYLSQITAFPTRLHVHPAKTQITRPRNLIRVFAGHSVCSHRRKVFSGGQRGLWSACAGCSGCAVWSEYSLGAQAVL